MRLPKVHVFPLAELDRNQRLFQALHRLFSLEFVGANNHDPAIDSVGAVFLGVSYEQAIRACSVGQSCLAFVRDGTPTRLDISEPVKISSYPGLCATIRGLEMSDPATIEAWRLPFADGDEVLARKGVVPLWIRRNGCGTTVDIVGTDLPDLGRDGFLFEYWQKENWASLLPLLNFLRDISGWKLPTLRACFMFDDPNLHWTSYGYINYAEVARHAELHNHHVSFATIPFDSWRVHRKTAALFRENKSRLSLLVHGNNHTSRELAQPRSPVLRGALAAQAIARTGRLERLSGLTIPRIMAPPHGACSHDTATALLRAGFEGACISRGSMMVYNPTSPWTPDVGLNVTEFMGEGLPIMHRFRIRKNCVSDIALSAFMGQAVIPVGHHGDLSGGLDLLAEVASLINKMGAVRWTDLNSLATTNYSTRVHGRTLEIRMHTRRAVLRVPAGIDHITVVRPWIEQGTAEELLIVEPATQVALRYNGIIEAIPVAADAQLELCSIPPTLLDRKATRMPVTPLSAILRRSACETRDRIVPAWRRIFRVHSAN